MRPGFALRPIWAQIMIILGTLIAAVAAVLMLVPAGSLTRNGINQICDVPIITMFPSDPYPQSDPQYAVSEACYRRAYHWEAVLVGVVAGGVALAAIAAAMGQPSGRFNPPAELAAAPGRVGTARAMVAAATRMAVAAGSVEVVGSRLVVPGG